MDPQPPHQSLFDDHNRPETAAELAATLAPAALPGHFDELRGAALSGDATKGGAPTPALTGTWGQFFDQLGHEGFTDLNRRTAQLQRQIRDNGVTYNVYADSASGPQRPWALDLFPLIVDAADWAQIEAGVLQRTALLEAVLADVYGPQQLLARGLLPPALVQGNPGYLRPMCGVSPPGGRHLHVAAFDLSRGPDGNWWVVSQSTQAPSGLGYLLENRLTVSRLFPQAFESLRVQRLAGAYRALVDALKLASGAGRDAHIALLTPGPYNETYFEHAYLARYLGLTLVEGSDLAVRDNRVYLKTLRGLEPVHGLLKRLDDPFLDPLELRPDSRLGVPGLLQAVRAGNVLVANAPGSGFLESAALLGFLPALCEHLRGEALQLPALPTWWCGERAAMEAALPRLRDSVIKPTYVGSRAHGSFHAVLGRSQSRRQIDEWAGRIVRQGEEHTVQSYLPLSQMPTWKADDQGSGGHIAPRSALLRVYALSDGEKSWRVLPGGLVRIASADAGVASMQRGGSSADCWVMTEGEVDRSTLLAPPPPFSAGAHGRRLVTSRAAENLFWLGRYTERTDNMVRLVRLALESLGGEDQSSQPLLAWLGELVRVFHLVAPGTPPATSGRRVFERSLIAGIGDADGTGSVGFNLRATKNAASAVRDRLSQEQWKLIVQTESELFQRCATLKQQGDYGVAGVLQLLESASISLAAVTGAQTDRMTRDDGWRLLSIGRHIERLNFLSTALQAGFETGAVHDDAGFEAMVALFDSTITFRALYQQRHDIGALLELLVLDRDNPRSLAWVATTLRGRLARLDGSAPGELGPISLEVPDPADWRLADLAGLDADGQYGLLRALLETCGERAWRVSDRIGGQYFTHTGEDKQSTGI